VISLKFLELPNPKLPKKSAKETMRESKMGVSGLTLNQSSEAETILRGSGNKENKIVNQSQSDLMAQAHELLNKRDQEESKTESRNSRMKKSAIEEMDDDLSAPIEKAVIQDVKQSVIIKADMLTNPFGDDLMKESMLGQSEIIKPEPESERNQGKIENPEENKNAVEDDDDNFDRIISKKSKGNGSAHVFDPTEYNQYVENNQVII